MYVTAKVILDLKFDLMGIFCLWSWTYGTRSLKSPYFKEEHKIKVQKNICCLQICLWIHIFA